MAKNWIVVVNRVEARIFDGRTMQRLHRLVNNLGREKNRAFTTDRPGVGRNRMAARGSIHNLTGEKKPHDEAALQFTRRLSLFLRRRLGNKSFEKLTVVAEPRMQGWLKKSLDKNVLDVCSWKSKDLGHNSDHELKILFLGKEAVWTGTTAPRSSF